MAKVPVIGPPPHWKWFPDGPWRSSAVERGVTKLADALWRQHFETRGKPGPVVIWSTRMGRTGVQARTYHWGIVLSQREYNRVAKPHRRIWLKKLLLHELLHWSGRNHRGDFYGRLRQVGGSL